MSEGSANADYARAFDTLDFLMGVVEAEAFQRLQPRSATELAVVLVTGFLGAGKTTLMRRLVSANHGLRLAAVVNDMANLNVDAALIAEAGAAQETATVALANGCVCCSQSGSVAKTLADIQAWPDPPDCVLLEASGVADPAALAGVIDGMEGIRLEAVVAVVDATAAMGVQNDAVRLIERGVGAAELVLLNKTDLVSPSNAEALEKSLARLAPKAAILRTVDCAVPPGLIFDLPVREQRPAAVPAIADDRFQTIELVQTRMAQRREIEVLIAAAPDGLYRAKGALRLADTAAPEFLQAVGRRWRWSPAGEVSAALAGRLVLVAAADAGDVATTFLPFFTAANRPAGLKLPVAR